MTYINTFDALGSDDRFVTSSIPIAAARRPQDLARRVLGGPQPLQLRLPHADRRRLLRAFIEADFAGGKDRLRLRHAFGQWGRWLIGQAFSTFSDPEAEPDGLDFEGLNAISLLRQPQVRYTQKLGARLKLAGAFEEANPDLTGATGVNQVPDLIVRLRYDPRRLPPSSACCAKGATSRAPSCCASCAAKSRPRRRAPETLSTPGYGSNLSGVLPAPWARDQDRFRFAWTPARGSAATSPTWKPWAGRTPLRCREGRPRPPAGRRRLPGLRALVAAHGALDGDRRLRLGGQPRVAAAADAAPHRALSLNLAWSPIPRLDLVAEYLWGRRINARPPDRRGRSAPARRHLPLLASCSLVRTSSAIVPIVR